MTAVATPVALPARHMDHVLPFPNAVRSAPRVETPSCDDEGANPKTRISAFVRKLRSMIDNDAVHHIRWTPDGEAFRVFDSVTFSRDVLPNYFKHNNWQSFIRQLNIYGFVKLTDANPSSSSSSSATPASQPQLDWTFKHPLFLRRAPEAMEEIKRRTPKTTKDGEPYVKKDKAARSSNAGAPASSQASKSNAHANSRGSMVPGSASHTLTSPLHSLFPPMTFHNTPSMSNGMAAAAAAAAATMAGLNPAATAAALGSGTGPAQPITTENVSLNPKLALKSTAGSSRIAAPISSFTPPLCSHSHGGNVRAGETEPKPGPSSVTSSSSGATLDGSPSSQSEAGRLRREMSALQGKMEALRRHLHNMDGVQSRAMAHVMQVLSTQARQDCPLSTVTELQDCLDTWRSMAEMAASFFPGEEEEESEDDMSEEEISTDWDTQSDPLFPETGVEPAMLLFHQPSLIDPPTMDLDPSTDGGDKVEPPSKRRKSK